VQQHNISGGMTSLRRCATTIAVLASCHAPGASRQDSEPHVVDGAPCDSLAVGKVDAQAPDPTLHYRCDARWSSFMQPAVLEEHDSVHWFCSQQLELESSEPITILDDNSQLGAEFTQWRLDVGGVRVDVRVNGEWANLLAEGWRDAEIERVEYPEVFGRSARRVLGNRVKRETDLLLQTHHPRRVHFRYEEQADRVAPVDLLIDQAHSPVCWGCKN
jgi:hypothetical protein